MKYEATELALSLKNIIVHHSPNGDFLCHGYDSSYDAFESMSVDIEDLISDEDKLSSWAHYRQIYEKALLIRQIDRENFVEYDYIDCIDAAEEGEKWPLELGLAQEIKNED